VNTCPQLFVAVPLQRSPQGLPVGVQPQPFAPAPPPPQTFGAAQVFGHVTTCPQLFVFGPHATPAQVAASGSGTQQLVPMQT
jgi:hypothetical protein